MPIITVKITKGRSIKQKQEFAKSITNEVERIFKVNKDWVTVVIEEHDRENWASGGELHILKYGQGFGETGVIDAE